jgi:hypothetical protein
MQSTSLSVIGQIKRRCLFSTENPFWLAFLRQVLLQLKRNVHMAKSQKKSNREIRKPKAAKPKTNAANPTGKSGVIPGLENMKR